MAPRALPLLSLSIVAFVVVACSSGTTGSPSPFGSGASPTDPKDGTGTEGSELGPACTEYLACCEELAKKTPQLAMSCEATKTQLETGQANGIATSSFEASCKSGVASLESAGYCKSGGTTQPVDPPEKKCVPSCNVDSDCANSCPAISGGVQCCDTKARVCFGSKTATCPKPEDGPIDPPPMY